MIISRLFLGKEILRIGVDRTGSKLCQVGVFVIIDFELRNIIEYYNSYVYRAEIYFNPGGAKFSMCCYLKGKLTFRPTCEGDVRQSYFLLKKRA
jgi:hypothetical protein